METIKSGKSYTSIYYAIKKAKEHAKRIVKTYDYENIILILQVDNKFSYIIHTIIK